MISTVTSSTISTISTVTAMGFTVALGVVCVLALIALLTTKELASAGQSGNSRLIAKFCDIGILPLVVAFGVTVVIKVVDILA
jgi:H+/Cl- antiporter ClcA